MGETRNLNPFSSPWRKVARAKTHIADLKREIKTFEDSRPYESFAETDLESPNQLLHKIKLVSPLPDLLAEILGDAVNNLRESLDYAGYACAIASGKVKPTSAYFPFAGDVRDLESKIGRNCKDLPQEITALFRSFQPYKGGNDLLWALNRIANANKHTILIPYGIVAERAKQALLHYHPESKFAIRFPPARWDSKKQEIIVAFSNPTTEFQLQCDFTISVAVDQVEIVGGQEIIAVLDKFTSVVEGILLAIEAEALRLGYVTGQSSSPL